VWLPSFLVCWTLRDGIPHSLRCISLNHARRWTFVISDFLTRCFLPFFFLAFVLVAPRCSVGCVLNAPCPQDAAPAFSIASPKTSPLPSTHPGHLSLVAALPLLPPPQLSHCRRLAFFCCVVPLTINCVLSRYVRQLPFFFRGCVCSSCPFSLIDASVYFIPLPCPSFFAAFFSEFARFTSLFPPGYSSLCPCPADIVSPCSSFAVISS